MQVATPCGALSLKPRGNHVVARLSAERAWLEQAFAMTQGLAAVRNTALPPIIDCAFMDDVLEVVYTPRPEAKPMDDPKMVVEILLAMSDVADAVAMLGSLPSPIRSGPFTPGLVLRDEKGAQLLAAGLWASAYGLDRTRAKSLAERHLVESPESLANTPQTEKTDAFYLAYVTYQLLTGHEPYPTERGEGAYREAVRTGANISLQLLRMDLPLDLARILDRALALDPSARPSPFDLAHQLREFTGAPKKTSTDPSSRKPWWQFW